MEQGSQQSEQILLQLLREWLSQQKGGSELWSDFERDPEGTAPRLRGFLLRAPADLPPPLASYVTGGRVERLVNIALAEVVHIHLPATELAITPEERQKLERFYLSRIAEECRYLETEGLKGTRAELTDVFVMLEAVESIRHEEPTDVAPVPQRVEEMGLTEAMAAYIVQRESERMRRSAPRRTAPPVPLSRAMIDFDHLVILGEPGTGKSTVLQFVALCFARNGWAKERLNLDEARVPILLDLRAYRASIPLGEFLVETVASVGQFDTLSRMRAQEQARVLVRTCLEEERLAVLLDGLDEVPESHRALVAQAIERFAVTSEGAKCRIVVTSRIAGYREIRGLEADFGHYTIRPFADPQDALHYISGWLGSLRNATPDAAKDEAQALIKQMRDRTGLRRVMSNPLLLQLAIAVHVETGELASSRAELYRLYVDAVAWKRAQRRKPPRWGYRQVLAALEVAAWTLHTRGEPTVTILAEVLEEETTASVDGLELLHYLREEMGLLAVYGHKQGELLAFRHLTFQEFFVARRLAQEWVANPGRVWRFLHPRLHHPHWRESILLLAGMLDKEQATGLARRVLRARSPYERTLHRDLLLATAIASDGVPLGPEIVEKTIGRMLSLFQDTEVHWRHKTANITKALLAMLIAVLLGVTILYPELRAQIIQRWIWLLDLIEVQGWGSWVVFCLVFYFAIFWAFDGVILPLMRSGLNAILAVFGPPSGRSRYSLLQTRLDDALVNVGMQWPQAIGDPLCETLAKHRYDLWPRITSILERIGWRVGPDILEILIRALEVPELMDLRRSFETKDKLLQAAYQWFLQHPAAIAPVIIQWWRTRNGCRQKAAEALGSLAKEHPNIVSKLTEALNDDYGGARWAAGQSLGKAGVAAPAAVAALLVGWGQPYMVIRPFLLGDEQRDELSARVSILAQFGRGTPKDIIPILLDVALSDNPQSEWIFFWTLRELDDVKSETEASRVIMTLLRLSKPKFYYACEALRKWGRGMPDIAAAMLYLARAFREPPIIVAEALGEIGVCDQDVMAFFIEMLQDASGPRLETVTSALANLQPTTPEVIKALVSKLGDRGTMMARTLIPFMPILAREGAWEVANTLVAIGRENPYAVKQAVLAAFETGDEYTREASAWILGELGTDMPDVLAALLDMQRPEEGRLWEALRIAFADPDTRQQQGELAAQGHQVQLAVSEALAKLGTISPRNVHALVTVSRDTIVHPKRRLAALEALGRLDAVDRKVAKTLTKMLVEQDRDIRLASAEALQSLVTDPKEAATTLCSAMRMRRPDVRKIAAEMAGHLAHWLDRPNARKAAHSLRRLLVDADDELSDSAYEALDRVVARLTELDAVSQ